MICIIMHVSTPVVKSLDLFLLQTLLLHVFLAREPDMNGREPDMNGCLTGLTVKEELLQCLLKTNSKLVKLFWMLCEYLLTMSFFLKMPMWHQWDFVLKKWLLTALCLEHNMYNMLQMVEKSAVTNKTTLPFREKYQS